MERFKDFVASQVRNLRDLEWEPMTDTFMYTSLMIKQAQSQSGGWPGCIVGAERLRFVLWII